MSHLTYTLLLAALVSGAEALLGKRTIHERANRAAWVFASCAVAVIFGGWAMFLIHR